MSHSDLSIYNLSISKQDNGLEVFVYGDITSGLTQDIIGAVSHLDAAPKNITVRINSYGGDLAEGIALYNYLKGLASKGARIETRVDGFACSAASIAFLAGDERIMPDSTIFMMHFPWMMTAGNSNQLTADAATLQTMGDSMAKIYEANSSLSLEQIQVLLEGDAGDGTWLDAETCLDYGFATKVEEAKTSTQAMMRSCIKSLFNTKKNVEKNIEDKKGNIEDNQKNMKTYEKNMRSIKTNKEEDEKDNIENEEENVAKNKENAMYIAESLFDRLRHKN